MTQHPTPREVAARLTKAQRAALKWLPAERGVERSCFDFEGNPMTLVVLSRDTPALCYATEHEGWMLSDLGRAVRAEIEREAGA